MMHYNMYRVFTAVSIDCLPPGKLMAPSMGPFLLQRDLNYGPILYYTILSYTILYYTILYYTILYYTILYYTMLYHTIL